VGHTIQISEETLLADIERRLVDEFPCVAPAAVNTLIREGFPLSSTPIRM
jgi:hypothetical protein